MLISIHCSAALWWKIPDDVSCLRYSVNFFGFERTNHLPKTVNNRDSTVHGSGGVYNVFSGTIVGVPKSVRVDAEIGSVSQFQVVSVFMQTHKLSGTFEAEGERESLTIFSLKIQKCFTLGWHNGV